MNSFNVIFFLILNITIPSQVSRREKGQGQRLAGATCTGNEGMQVTKAEKNELTFYETYTQEELIFKRDLCSESSARICGLNLIHQQ